MIKVENVVKIYNKGKKNEFQALNGVSMTVNDGEMVAIVGRSGAGKSTLLHIIGAIDGYDSGSCSIDGVELKGLSESRLAKIRNEKVGVVMQDFALIEDYTVAENVGLVLKFAHISGNEYREKVESALERTGIKELGNKEVSRLSGGQKQRCAIARAIVNDPSFILADEPTGALDSATGREIMELFKTLNAGGHTVVIITHDSDVANMCGRKIVMDDGRIRHK